MVQGIVEIMTKKANKYFFYFFYFFCEVFTWNEKCVSQNVRLCTSHILCVNWCQMRHKDISDIIDANCECFGCYSTSVDDMSSMYLTVSLRTLHNFSQNNIHLRNLCRVKYHSWDTRAGAAVLTFHRPHSFIVQWTFFEKVGGCLRH